MENIEKTKETELIEIGLAEQYNAGFAFADASKEWPWFSNRDSLMTDNTVNLIMLFGERYHFHHNYLLH